MKYLPCYNHSIKIYELRTRKKRSNTERFFYVYKAVIASWLRERGLSQPFFNVLFVKRNTFLI